MSGWLRRIALAVAGRVGALVRGNDGVSAIEFALLAPVLIFAAAATLDLGLAAYERMTMDRLLRGGAQAAMADPGEAQVQDVIEASAEDDFAPGQEFTLMVDRYCVCPDDTLIVCTSTCSDGSAPDAFYRLEAVRTYEGLVLPAFELEAQAKVQIR